METFETNRLILRPFNPEDLDSLLNLYLDPEDVKYMGLGKTKNRDEMALYMDKNIFAH